ncbi:hypothetical protein HMPREF9393_0642 [Streptococcus sanguinis SK1056]|uniref:Uncharacterized protein n=2 Tax=Streptococcus sanguinis TaxID=1305 RepID=F3UAZ9_STRSA|nr:hypothetical protein HMPREF9380_1307 [Streptococcus sanguinis SK49]EGJ39020.1 hypothetical protein HMPREF9393_0642 [Streptococcus sanguinis SK1056]PLA64868.1 hypothetical protein CYK23_02665 [Streptococcus salivarius]
MLTLLSYLVPSFILVPNTSNVKLNDRDQLSNACFSHDSSSLAK